MKPSISKFSISAFLLISTFSSIEGLQAQNIFPATGNAGIGITTPALPLEIAINTTVAAKFRNRNTSTTADGSIIFDMANNSGNMWRTIVGGKNNGLGINAGQYYIERVGLGATLLINQLGNVLINKVTQTNTSYKLEVNGKVRANEIVVNTTGADFVFAPEYKLSTLQEVESYVKANKHLPGVASAAEMTEQGVEVGELTKTLLQKVEELTLYIIEQQKHIDSLEAKVAN